jgi:hypothetical protein
VELLLASLGTCLTIGWVTQAAKRGVDFRDLTIEVRGEYDLRGYPALDDVRSGFSEIGYSVKVESDASADVLDEIRVAAERTSPIFHNVINGRSWRAAWRLSDRGCVHWPWGVPSATMRRLSAGHVRPQVHRQVRVVERL